MYICDGCNTPHRGVMDIQDGKLCLKCYDIYSRRRTELVNAENTRLATLAALSSYASEDINYKLGFQVNPPKFAKDIIMNQNLNFEGNAIGVVNTGEMNAHTISPNVQYNAQQNSVKELKTLFNQLRVAASHCDAYSENSKRDVIDSVDCLEEEINKTPENRRNGVIKSISAGIETLATSSENIMKIWTNCAPLIATIMGT